MVSRVCAVAELIRTPDRRVRVFVSSTLGELAAERAAAREAIEQLRLIPVLFELGARPHPPRALYRSYLDQSDVFVGVYWQRYGWVAPGEEVSGLEDEYRLAAGRLPQLVYVKEPGPEREPRLEALLQRIQDDDRLAYRRFTDLDELRALIVDDLAVLLSERFQSDVETVVRSPLPLPHPLDRTMGRDDEVEAIGALVRDGHRLVTLTGAGGIGKTRLAIEASRRLAPSFDDRVVFVSLAAVDDAARVLPLVAERLGVRLGGVGDLGDEIAAELRDTPTLLVLDNFEHVTAAAPEIAAILVRAPRSAALITSRHVLRVAGEREHLVPPLSTDAAVELFVDRAIAVRPSFSVDDEGRSVVAEVCAQLDGLPLAIELAAACMRLFTPETLLAQLSKRFELLSRGAADAPERQRTMRATMDWSYELLDEAERRLFARLAIFNGGWTLPAAEQVCGRDGEPSVLDVLANLVEKSLVAPVDVDRAEPRLHMLETVRTYAAERLADDPDRADTARRHVAWMFDLLLGPGRTIRPPHHESWLEQFDLERGNLRAAVQGALAARDPATVLDLVRSTLGYLSLRDAETEGAAWLDEALALGVDLDAATLARLHMTRAVLAGALGRYAEAEQLMAASRREMPEPIDAFDRAIAAMADAVIGSTKGDPGRALELARTAAEAMAAIGSDVGEAYMWQTAGTVALSCDPDCADDHLQRALRLAEAMANDGLRAQALTLLGFSARRAGRPGDARRCFIEAAESAQRGGQRSGMAYALDGLAAAALDDGKPESAVRALASSAAIRLSLDRTPWAAFHPLLDEVIAAAHAALGEAAHAAALAEGAGTDVRQALTRILGEIDRPTLSPT
jgi:predicted ATPase